MWLTVFEGQDILAASFTSGDGPQKTVNVFYAENDDSGDVLNTYDDKYFDKQAIFEEKLGEDRID